MAAEISISGVKKVKTLQREFKESFNLTLRIYNGAKFADGESTIAKIKKDGAKGGDIKIVGNIKVGNLEDKFLELYGIKVQIASADDSKLVSNDLTLAAAAKL